jgi:2-keto-3-deoxy-L-rhamnonate aldolase RhmA
VEGIRQRVARGELAAGVWCNLGSSLTVEMAAFAGFDWVLIDVEHGAGDHEALVHQVQAVAGTRASPIVRIAWNEAPRFKRVLDLGAAGVMVPYVSSPEEARLAVSSMRYPPQGIRGVARLNRASGYGERFDDYFARANDDLLTIVQIETAQAVERAGEIAAIDGVDVLFIGPLDLSVNLGIPQQFDDPRFLAAQAMVADASRAAGKAAGILLARSEEIGSAVARGFSFLALGSDGGMVASGMKRTAQAFQPYRKV